MNAFIRISLSFHTDIYIHFYTYYSIRALIYTTMYPAFKEYLTDRANIYPS